jgi:hypothetical protein
MNDYLAHLVGRTQSDGAAVRPRLASIFEPVGAGAPATVSASAENPDENSPSDTPLRRSKASVPEDREEEKSSTALRRTTFREVLHRERIVVTPEKSPALLDGIETLTPSVGVPTPAKAAVNEQHEKAQEDRHRNAKAARGDREQDRADQLRPMVRPVIEQNLPAQRQVSPALLNTDESQRHARLNRWTDHRVSDGAELRAANRVSIQGVIHQQKNADVEPSIHVSIGRIEIRAATAAAQPRSMERRPSPVMALDDYLRQRGKRGRE